MPYSFAGPSYRAMMNCTAIQIGYSEEKNKESSASAGVPLLSAPPHPAMCPPWPLQHINHAFLALSRVAKVSASTPTDSTLRDP
jgi:hypothetical protein